MAPICPRNHFTDLDEFLAELIIDRAHRAAEDAARLPSLAGTGTVTGNLTNAAMSVLQSDAFRLASLVLARPSLMNRIQEATDGSATSALDDIERAFAAYLDAERDLGRIVGAADTQTLALTLVGAVHHLFLTNRTDAPDLPGRVRRIVDTLAAAVRPG